MDGCRWDRRCAATEHLVLVRNEPVQGFASMGSASLPNSPNPALGPMHGAPVSMQGMGVVGVGVGMGMAGVPSQMPQMGMMGTGGMAQAGMMPPGAHPMARTPSPGVQGMGPSQGGLGHHYPGARKQKEKENPVFPTDCVHWRFASYTLVGCTFAYSERVCAVNCVYGFYSEFCDCS